MFANVSLISKVWSARPPHRHILGMRVDSTSYVDATQRIMDWAGGRESRYVCVASVNNAMESYDSATFRRVMNEADLVTPDGMPLVCGLRLLGIVQASRVYGPDLTGFVLKRAAREGVPVGFYGSTPDVLKRLLTRVRELFPDLRVVYSESPPFRSITAGEDRETIDKVNTSGARILFIGLSTPKQDRWMAEHCGQIQAVMIGVGAAFDFLSGTKRQAPRWMMAAGLEWVFRLFCEPRRLWRRYLWHNPRFVVLFGLQIFGLRRF